MIQIDLPAILAALEFRHLWWVIAASFIWSLVNVLANQIISRVFKRQS